MEISKVDWKLFQVKIVDWQEKYMEKLCAQYVKLLSDKNKDASDKFWMLDKRIKRDKKNPGVLIKMSKQNCIIDICSLIKNKIITMEDLTEFSDDLRNNVKYILEVSK